MSRGAGERRLPDESDLDLPAINVRDPGNAVDCSVIAKLDSRGQVAQLVGDSLSGFYRKGDNLGFHRRGL